MENTMNNLRRSLIAGLAFGLVTAPANADSLNERIAAAQKAGSPTWITWSAPSAVDTVACCWSGRNSNRSGTCSLAGTSYGMNFSHEKGAPGDTGLDIYVHVDRDGVDKVRVFSNSCRVDPAGEAVAEVAAVRPQDSVAYLATLVKGSDERATKRVTDGALSAIALHDDKSVDPVLEQVARTGDTKSLRHSAAFWLGNTRGQTGYEALTRLRSSEDDKFREHLTFCFSQSNASEAQSTLIDMAKNDPASRVRGQALFWIAQKAQKKSDADVIRQAADNDPDADIKKKAVFALSQIPHGEGVPDLIRVAKENKSREVRKQAMFWLGQSKDPRALEFFESVLAK
jgi:hypothetical protein